jgi:hypothetical protein
MQRHGSGEIDQINQERRKKRMKKIFIIGLVVVLMATLIPGVALADKSGDRGNGLPKGKSYNFNVIGVPNEMNANFDGGQGKRIFILRTGTTQFYVHGAEDTFAILDRDGTDGKVGWSRTDPGIILPYDTSEDKWDCRVYVRLLGPVGSSFKWKSEYYDGSDWALIDTFTLDRSSKFTLKNSQILKDGYEDVLWTWSDKDNFKICQFRIFVGATE